MSEFHGLRARLAAALVAVSALTLIVTALLVLFPLDRKLEQDAVTSLEETARTARPAFSGLSREQVQAESPRLTRAVHSLKRQTGAEVFVFDGSAAVLAGTDIDPGQRFPEVPRALEQNRLVSRTARGEGSKQAHVAVPFNAGGRRGVLVLRRSLEGLGGVQGVVRRSLVAAAFVALAVALVAGIALATRLVRRLTVLRGSALDHGRARARRHPAGRRRPPRRGRRPGARVRDDAAPPGGAGAVAANVREHRVARAAHAADLARADAARRAARS